MYLSSGTGYINATLTKVGELQAIDGTLKFTSFFVGDTEVDYRFPESTILTTKIMEANSSSNQIKYKIIADLPEGSTTPSYLTTSQTTINLNIGNSTYISVVTGNGSDQSYNVINPRADLITLYGNNSSSNNLTQTVNIVLNNSLSGANINTTATNGSAVFIIEANSGLIISETITLTIVGNDSGATEQITINLNR